MPLSTHPLTPPLVKKFRIKNKKIRKLDALEHSFANSATRTSLKKFRIKKTKIRKLDALEHSFSNSATRQMKTKKKLGGTTVGQQVRKRWGKSGGKQRETRSSLSTCHANLSKKKSLNLMHF